jgi:hypothetical protein
MVAEVVPAGTGFVLVTAPSSMATLYSVKGKDAGHPVYVAHEMVTDCDAEYGALGDALSAPGFVGGGMGA